MTARIPPPPAPSLLPIVPQERLAMQYDHVHFAARPVEIYLQTGALISLGSCAIIISSYLRKRRWRRHPNPLLFWKAVVDLVYALRFLFVWDAIVSPLGCRALAALTQFCMIASECWFVSVSLDLYRCSTNPFTNVKQSMQWYHAFAWGTGALFALSLWLSRLQFDFDSDQDPFCYVTERDTRLQMVYYSVVVLSVLCALALSVLESRTYPHGGMQQALQAKKDVIRSARIFTTAYIIYQTVLISLWIADLVALNVQSVYWKQIRNTTFLLQASKGLIDLVIWVSMNGRALTQWPASDGPLDGSGGIATSVSRSNRASETSSSGSSSSSNPDDRYSDINIDLEPQLNVELRKEVLHFTTRGVVAASANARRIATEGRTVARLRLHELGMVVRFNDYQPCAFREIRRGFGIDEATYRKSFLATCHERIQSGGSSGAFLFFTADYVYLVKTVTATERNVLLKMLPSYIAHMRAHPQSHLTRYYGCHSIEMYGQVFNFVVMSNVIGRISMHQFYDIKGSWIDRHASPIPPGKTVICTYCSNAFRYGSAAHCEYSIHGTHLPHVVLKDNDFHRKLRVQPETAQEIVTQLDADTAFLRSQGITDYSLLLSIHSTKYVVDMDTLVTSGPTKRRVNYNSAVCHLREGDQRGSTASEMAMRVNVEIVDAADSSSSCEDEYKEDMHAAVDLQQPPRAPLDTGSRVSGFLSRHFRYSVLHHQETSDDVDSEQRTPLLMSHTETIPLYESTTTTTSPDQAESHWIGTRSLEKPGYQACAVIGPDYYTLGVVDMLQTWTLAKRLERLWKVWVLRYDANGISAAPPGRYAERFRRKMREIMMVPNSNVVGFGHQ